MKRKVKDPMKRILHKAYHLLLLMIYHPKKKWEKEYVGDLWAFATSGVWHRLKQNFLTFLEERKDLLEYPWSKAWRVFDFWLCVIFVGAEDEDYFGYFRFYENGWKYRRHCVTRQRLNFINKELNVRENRHFVGKKSEFATLWSSYFARPWAQFPGCTCEHFCDVFKNSKRLIIKPEYNYGGKGIYSVTNDGNLEQIFSSISSKNEAVIIEEYIDQIGYLHDCNPTSLNTLRTITFRLEDQVYLLPSAYFRAGGKGAMVDNLHSGGVFYEIDVNTGIIQWGHSMNSPKRYYRHPSTDIEVAGYQIPEWDRVVRLSKEAHLLAPSGIDYIGWDICVSGDKIFLIEGNCGPGIARPLDKNDDIWGAVKDYMNLREESEANGNHTA